MAGEVDIIDPREAATIPALFAERARRSGDHIAYRQYDEAEGRWRSWTWSAVAVLVGRWRAGLKRSGLVSGDRVAILCRNGIEWACFDLAALGLGLVVVPLYTNDSPQNHVDMLADAAPGLLVVENEAQWRALEPQRKLFPALHTIVQVRGGDGAALADWLPKDEAAEDPTIGPGTLASITYTSGTTNRPKGTMLTHANLVFAANSALRRVLGRSDDVFLSFLPLAHILERTVGHYVPMACGAEVVFARSVRLLAKDLRTVRPTIVVGVPLIFERAWQRLAEKLSANPLGQALKRWLASSGEGYGAVANAACRFLVARFVAPRLLKEFGGRVRVAISGAAPLPLEPCRGLRAAGLPLTEGYGLTEAAGPVTGETSERYVPGTVGRPLPGVELRLSEGGEILVRSGGVMRGYWQREAENAAALDAEGWLHTGDLGQIAEGRLSIIGRISETIVMSNGEKVAPAGLEARILADPLFEQAVVVGNRRPFLVALVVLNEKAWQRLAKAHRLDPTEQGSAIGERILLDRVGAALVDCPRHAQIRRVRPTGIPWTVDNELATVTLKPKRTAITRRFAAELDELYKPVGTRS